MSDPHAAARKLLVFGLVLVALVAAWSCLEKEESQYCCETCRSYKETYSLMGIPLRSRTYIYSVGRYYNQQVDTHHVHHWECTSSHVQSLFRGYDACGSSVVGRIPEQVELSILQALPDRRTRMAFCKQFSSSDGDIYRMSRVRQGCRALDDAYYKDPHRKDWLPLVRKVGLYPNVRP